jgi:hypothetical protein
MRYTSRIALFSLLPVLAWSLARGQGAGAEPVQPAAIAPVAIDEREEELPKLLKRRHNAAVAETRAIEGLYTQGRVLIYQVLASQQRLAAAGTAMSKTPAERLTYAAWALDSAATHEDIIRARFEAQFEPVQTMYHATAIRLTREIDLADAQIAAGQTTPEDQKATLPKLLAARHDATTKEAEALDVLYRGGRVPLEEVIDVHQRLAHSGTALYATPAERIAHLDKELKHARAIEQLAQEKLAAEIQPRHALLQARQLSLDLEIEKVQIQLATMEPPPGGAPDFRREPFVARLQTLLKDRFQAASDEVAAKRALFLTGRITLHDLAHAVRRQALAGVSLSKSPADEVSHHQAALDAAQEFETLVRSKVEAGVETAYSLHFATGERLTAEIDLLRARQAAAPRRPAAR